MRWLLLSFVLVVGVGVAFSQEQPPRKPNAKKVAQKRAADDRGTEKQPLVVKTLEPEKTAERIHEERAKEDEKADREERLVFWTLALALVTGVLALIATGFCWEYLYHMQRGRFIISRDSALNKRT